MNIYRKFIHWAKYGELSYYPALKLSFEPGEAMKRLREYHREEGRTCKPWLRYSPFLPIVMMLVISLLIEHKVISGLYLVLPVILVQLIATIVLCGLRAQRYTRFINAKIAEDLNGGRWWNCAKCGWNVREEQHSCPECGTSVFVSTTTKEM